MNRAALISEVQSFLVSELKLPIAPESIQEHAPLFGGDGLGIDSIDALQVGVAAEIRWGVKLDPNSDAGKAALGSLGALADFILANQP
jgi:acyl carrier protein